MKVSRTINLRDADLRLVTLHPGDTVPEWAEKLIANPKVILNESMADEVEPEAPEVPEVAGYSKAQKADLVAMLAERGLPTEGKVAELRARLEADDVAQENPEEIDLWSMTEKELRALATERGLDTEGATTTAELIAVIGQE